MVFKKGFFLVFFFLLQIVYSAKVIAINNSPFTDSVKVSVLGDVKISSALVSHEAGRYTIMLDNKLWTPEEKDFLVQLSVFNDSIELRTDMKNLGRYARIKVVGIDTSSAFKLKPVIPAKALRSFEGNLEVTVKDGGLKFINTVPVNIYVAGVVESEVGVKAHYEYYKVQSILCRTYALSHLRRHESEGFNLCDNVHCQAYRGKQKSHDLIERATKETKGLVIVDASNELILAAFHSNSGGQTINAEEVWNHPKPYLKSVVDTFSNNQTHFRWEKKIPRDKWIKYFVDKYHYNYTDSLCCTELFNYTPAGRQTHFLTNPQVLLKNLRTDFGLNSTWFAVKLEKDVVVLTGRGYGHGVGLSQEGAMRMAKLGYNYKQILNFYYKGIHLVDLHMLEFFKE